MRIDFDYRFDRNGFFDNPNRRAALEKAGEIWSSLISDSFENIPAGVEFAVQNPTTGSDETIILDEEIDDILIFVGANTSPYAGKLNNGQALIDNSSCHLNGCCCCECSSTNEDIVNLSQPGILNPDKSTILGKAQIEGTELQGDIFQRRVSNNFRNQGVVTNYEPWAGSISFNSQANWDFSLDNPDSNQIDFLSVALHEIGHILGIGTAPIFTNLSTKETFKGVNSKAVNNGKSIPLESDLSHVKDGFQGNSVLLDPIKNDGRNLPSDIDLAMLADIGYEIDGFTTQGSTPALATNNKETIFGSMIADNINGLLGNDEVQGGVGNDTLFGGKGDDLLFGQKDEDLVAGGEGDDELQGGASNDTLQGDTGKDLLFGQGGDDFLVGGENNDQLQGGVGNDTLFGGKGNDTMLGGSGEDTFLFDTNNAQDTINQFIVAEDKIELAANLGFASGNEVLDAVTSSGTSSVGGLFSEITLSPGNTISIFHDTPLTADNFVINIPLQVTDFQSTASGFVLNFNQSIDVDLFNLYSSQVESENLPDFTLVSKSTGEVVKGSAIWNEDDNTITFVKTGEILADDEYTLNIFSRQDGLVTQLGTLLDGNGDDRFGDDFTRTFTIDNLNQPVLNINDFSHAPGQEMNMSTQTANSAITIDNGAGVTQVDFNLTFNPDILGVTDILVNPDLAGWQVTQKDFDPNGEVVISMTGETALTTEPVELVFIDGEVSETATYGRSSLVTIESVQFNNGSMAGVGDTGVLHTSVKGDVSGDGSFSGLDASLIAHTSVGFYSGFDAYGTSDPLIIGDVNLDGNISALDASLVVALPEESVS